MDIYVANRKSVNDPWSAPVQLEEPVNSTANDFCPTPLSGGSLLFVSNRADAVQDCNTVDGAGDIYYTRLHPVRAPQAPVNLGCQADGSGPNFGGAEFSPSLVTTDEGTWLFFSSTGPQAGNQDIYVSELGADGRFGTPARVDELSTGFADQMPNVSPDGRVIVFLSNRPDGAGSDLDVFMATRASVTDAWSPPVRLGPEVNGAGDESRPTMSADGHRLYFGRSGDIWMSTQ
jgi:Tol biopolymer transport system component